MAEKGPDIEMRIIVLSLIIGIVYAAFFGTRFLKTGPLIQISTPGTMQSEEPRVLAGETDGDQCRWKPTQDYGSCKTFLGYYSDGSKCVPIMGCSLKGDLPPFFSQGDCEKACHGK